MTEDELKAIEARYMGDDDVSGDDIEALIAEIRRLQEDLVWRGCSCCNPIA